MCQEELILGSNIFSAIDAENWDRLAQSGVTNTPFQTHAYQQAWWTHLGQGDLVSVVVRDDAENLIGIGVFYLLDGRLQFNASKEETDYLDILADAEHVEMVWDAVLTCLCSSACPAWDVLDCYNIPAHSPSRNILPRLAESRGFVFSEGLAEVCPVIQLDGSFDDYLAGIDKKQRHEIRRKMRRAKGADATLEIVGPDDDLHAAVDEFLVLLQKSTAEKGAWLNAGRTAVFHEVADAALAAGTLLLMFMVVDGQRIAALFNFAYNGRVWVYNSGIDTTRYGNLSLGVVLTSHAIEYAVNHDCQTFDFLRGDETYKYRFGATDTQIFRIQLERPAS